MKKRLFGFFLAIVIFSVVSIQPIITAVAVSSTGIVTANVLNVRNGPGTNYTVVDGLKVNTTVYIIDEQPGWYKIGESRWISSDFVVKQTVYSNDVSFDVVVTTDVLNIRSGPGTGYSVIGGLNRNYKVRVYGEENGWYKIGENKWISAQFVSKNAEITEILPDSVTNICFYGTVTTDVLNIRSGPGTGYSVVGGLNRNSRIMFIGQQNNWYKIADGKWVSGDFISKEIFTNNTVVIPKDDVKDYYQKIPYYGTVNNSVYEKVDWLAAVNQTFTGEWSGKTTAYGSTGEVILSLSGADAYKDVTDLMYYLSHWKNTWGNYISAGICIISIVPIIGVIKNADEANLVAKNLKKTIKFKTFFLSASKADIIKLAKKLDAHAFSKHVGKTEKELLSLRKGTKSISTFYNIELAEEVIQNTLKKSSNQKKIIGWLNSKETKNLNLDYSSSKNLGYGFFDNGTASKITKNARVSLKKDSNDWFYVLTAFPK